MTSPMSGGQARRVNFSLPLLRLFQSTGDPGGAEVAGMTIPEHGHIRIPVQNRADGRRPDRRSHLPRIVQSWDTAKKVAELSQFRVQNLGNEGQ